jgi:hypothetical protein
MPHIAVSVLCRTDLFDRRLQNGTPQLQDACVVLRLESSTTA